MIENLGIEKNKSELLKKGYSIIENRLSPKTLKSAQLAYNEIYKLALYGDYNHIRVYDDYSNVKNISGIEAPFHEKILRQEIIDLVEESKIIDIAKNIMQDDVVLELSRYHLTKKFSHVGIWHRDEDIYSKKYETLQLNIYLFAERGIQVIEGSHQKEDENIDSFLKIKKNQYSSLKSSKWLKTSGGDILVFDPSILHRGISMKSRANIHFRFRKKNNKNYAVKSYNFLEKFKISGELKHQILYNLNGLTELTSYKHPKSIKYSFRRIIRRFIYTFVIFLPLNSKIYSYFLAWPNLTIRKFFKFKI